jgi:MATE family multidrug resistance protein
MNIVGFAIFEGMATSLDTLCAQAYGSGNLKLVGLHTQRMILFLLLVATPIGALWICSLWILSAIVPQKELAVMAGSFLRISLIGVPGYAIFEAGKRFFQAQGNFTASLVVLIICVPVNLVLNWLFVSVRFPFSPSSLSFISYFTYIISKTQQLQWGVSGAALAAAFTNDIRPILLFFYIRWAAPWTLQCWPGFTLAAVRNWGPMVWLSLSGAIMTLCEWFAFEILTFSTSYLSTEHLATQIFLSTASVLVWHVPFSASIAISTRIGQLIGSGAVTAARKATRTYTIICVLIGLIDMALLVFALKIIISRLIIQDHAVRALILRAMPVVALFQLFDATTCCVHGIMRGLGRQNIGGWVTFCVNYLYAVPLALYLELGPLRLGLSGLWIALSSGLALLTVVETVVIMVLDWGRCVDDARNREEAVDS